MASDSKCERIAQYWVDKFKAGEDARIRRFTTVQRTGMDLTKLRAFTHPQLPVLAIINSLPVPIPHQKGRRPGGGDAFLSELKLEFVVYGMDNVAPASSIVDLADDLWVILHGDQTSGDGGLALTIGLEVSPESMTYILDPYFAFKMIGKFQYYHTTGGI